MIDVYLCVTLYHLYVALLFIESKNNRDNSVILLDANDKQIYDNFCKYSEILQANGYTVDLHMRSKIKNSIGLEVLEGRKQYQRIEKNAGIKLKNGFNLYNFAWNCQYAYPVSTYFIKKCSTLFMMEEGAQTAFVPAQPKIKILLKRLTGNIVDFYKLEKLDGIYIQKPDVFPQIWDKKKYLDLNGMVSNLDQRSKQRIIKVFLGDLYSKLVAYDFSNTGIVYTQALSEDKYISEETKIQHYTDVVDFYSRYAAPIVKLHPRDKTVYPFSSKILVLPSSIPSEVLGLIGIKFKYAIAICSSAVLTTNAEIKINLNENFNNDQIFKLIPIEEDNM